MAKISMIAAKYIIHASFSADGIVDKPDVIGAIFGQTEGLLGSDLELRELQRSGRIGRIEVELENKAGKTNGKITIPSSLDKAETCIVAAALEVIQRVGPCNAKIKVEKIEDVRVSKRKYIVERAKELLKMMLDTVLPDSQELSEEVASAVRVMELQEYGVDRLPAGPAVDESEDIIIVEGRADVINLLKNGFKNVIAMNGSSVPKTVIELSKKKTTTVFVDGDRGGLLELRELLQVADIDFVARAPDGKEVEELTKKEIHKCLRNRISADQIRMELHIPTTQEQQENKDTKIQQNFSKENEKKTEEVKHKYERTPHQRTEQQRKKPVIQQEDSLKIRDEEKEILKDVLEDLIGTRGAYLLDKELNILGKVPVSELISTLKSLDGGVYALVFDGNIDNRIVELAEKIRLKYVVGMKNNARRSNTVVLLSANELY